ncbi:helicase-like transcription factor CHR27, partial [Carica papaya]|uniref:helicase-like transcription factor CHR27 n=1 Tax=Carica papaya TaxID=3649 RepID=UPI000B8CE331
MHENQDDLCDFVDSATKSWSYSRGWIFSLILRHCTNLLGSFIRNSPSDSVEGSENHHLRWMDPIDISSSDSDLEIEESIPREGVSGILPAWASGSKTNSGAGNGAPSWRAPSPKGVYASNGSSSNVNNHSQMKQQLHSSPNGDRGALNQHSWEDPKYFSKNGNLDQPWSVNSRIANVSGADYEKLSSQQALKRTLPASLHSHIPGPKVNNSVGKGSSSEIRDTHESPYHSAGISSTESSWVHDTHGNPHHSHGLASGNFKGYMKDHYSWNNNDDIMMYENNRSRILPPSLVHGASASSAQIVGSGDSMNRYAAGEERISGNDERLIYQAALE